MNDKDPPPWTVEGTMTIDANVSAILVDCSILNPELGLKPGMHFTIDVGGYHNIRCVCALDNELCSVVGNIRILEDVK